MSAATSPAERESALGLRWLAGVPGPLWAEDGRAVRVVFPGVPGGGAGPDVHGAVVDLDGDLLRGDVEFHLLASGWRRHGHHRDPAYRGVVLHVVGRNDLAARSTAGAGGRAIPTVVLPPVQGDGPPAFVPPCAFATRAGVPIRERLEALGLRRLRARAASVTPMISAGAGQVLWTLLLDQLGGRANREAFRSLARVLPISVLMERSRPDGRATAMAARAELIGAAAGLSLSRTGMRPTAAPAARLASAGALAAALWEVGEPSWPGQLTPGAVPAVLQAGGIGRALALELAVNAVLPAALATGAWAEDEVAACFARLRSPGTYGKLRPLEAWLGGRPFGTAMTLQGALQLQRDYCDRGRCGRCPLSPPPRPASSPGL
jgi:hypothetical protein